MLRNLAGSRGVLLALLTLAAALPIRPAPAHACTRAAAVVFEPDPSLRALDSRAPTPFRGINARVDRQPATVCKGDECTSASCGSFGTIALDFTLPSDDQSDAGNLGYRVVWLRGARPSSASALLANSWPLSEASQSAGGAGTLSLELSYDDVANLDAEIALVAIDRAGNESEPSEPIHLEWSGCTRDFTHDQQCLEDLSCSVARVSASRAPRSLTALALVLLAIAWRIRRSGLSVGVRHGSPKAERVQ